MRTILNVAKILLLVTALFLITTPGPLAEVHASVPTNNSTGEQRVLVIPVEFADNQTTVGTSAIESRMGFVDSYIRTASYNQTWVSYQVLPAWTKLNGTFQSFAYPPFYGCPNLAVDTIKAVQSIANLSSYRYVLIIHTGYSFNEMRSEYVGSNCASVNPAVVNLAIASLADQTTTWVHELLHSIGGYVPGHSTEVIRVQDLYEESLAYLPVNDNIYVDGWDIMSTGTGGMTAWTRMELGGIPRSEVQLVPTWGDVPVNLTSLDSPGGGTKVLMVPISEQPLSLVNGSTITAWSYYIVEFRTPTGIDKNLTQGRPVVLVTLANQTKYFEGQSGPLLFESSLYFQLGSTPSFSDSRLNLTISVLNLNSDGALVLLSHEGAQVGYVKAAQNLDTVLQGLATGSRLAPFMGASLVLTSAQKDSSMALSALSRGDLTGATVMTESAANALGQAESNLALYYEVPFYAADAIALVVLLAFIAARRPPTGHTRYYALRGRKRLIAVLVGCPIIIGAAAVFQANGAANIGYAVANGSNTYLSDGWWTLLEGAVFWTLFVTAAFLCIRNGEFDIEDEVEDDEPAEEQPGEPGDS